MPFRCQNCSKVYDTDEVAHPCGENQPCDLMRVAMIHLASPNGTGRKVGSTIRSVGETEKIENAPIHLHCQSQVPDAMFTNVIYAATCPTCLLSVQPAPEPVPPEPESVLDEAQQHADQLDEPSPT